MTTPDEVELIAPADEWRAAAMRLSADPAGWATGRLVRAGSRQPVGMLVRDLTAVARTGTDFPPLAGWVAVAVPGGDQPDRPDGWVARLRPRPGQLLAVVLVGFGPDRSGWRGWTVGRGRAMPLAGLRVVGPGMVRAGITEPDDDPARWTRLRGAVGERAYAKLRDAAVAVVGCSRTGTPVATMLAALGVRHLTVIDGDAVEIHNLDGMLLATPADVGSNKAVALARRLVEFRPDFTVRAVARPLDSTHPTPSDGRLDLVATCVDQDAPRLRVAHWARETLTPHLDIGTGVTRSPDGGRLLAADVRLLLPGLGCVSCVGSLRDLDQAEYELYAPPGALPRRPAEPWDARGRLGSLATLNGLAASVGVQSWLDLLDGPLAGSVWHRLRWRPGTGLEANAALVTAAEGCPVCHQGAAQTR